jgi:hypothetical protein
MSDPVSRPELQAELKSLESRMRLTVVIAVFAANAVVTYVSPAVAAGVAGLGIVGVVAAKLLPFLQH